MRAVVLTLSTVFALGALAVPADAQIRFGVQGGLITSVDDLSTIVPGAPDLKSTYGFGARGAFQAPALPIGLIAQGVVYAPDGDGYDYLTYSLAAQLRLSTPVISPYAIGGWQWTRTSNAGTSITETGPMIGLGVELSFGLALFLEAVYEFKEEVTGNPDFDNSPIVIKGGFLFG